MKNRNWTFPRSALFDMKLEFASNTLSMIVVLEHFGILVNVFRSFLTLLARDLAIIDALIENHF